MNLRNLYKYEPPKKNNFTLSPIANDKNLSFQKEEISETIYKSINQNLDFVKTKYNKLINSDIIIREFSLVAKNKQYNAFLLYIDGMVDTQLINQFILNPLMIRNKSNILDGDLNFESTDLNDNSTNKITVKKIQKFNLEDFIFNSLVPQNSIEKITEFSKSFDSANSGNCILFVDTIPIAFDIDVKGFEKRSLDTPQNENVIKGPQEAFIENLRTNTSLLRRIIHNQNLIIENISIGNISKTQCALCYIKNIANSDLVAETKLRLNNLDIDTLISSGQLEQLIQDQDNCGIPSILSTERPDKCARGLLQGRIVVLINGNPYGLILPAVFTDFLASPEDSNLKPLFANFLKLIRLFAIIIALLLPGFYIAVTGFHQELLPTELLFSITSARQNVPFPIIFELLLMEISFELIREGGLRIPSPVGTTLGIVGALILGDAAVSANLVSPILIIVVAITGISSFAIPDYSFSFHLRIYRFAFIFLGYIAGFLGIGAGIYIYICLICSIKTFGVSFSSTILSLTNDLGIKYFLPPFWKQEHRPGYLHPKKELSQNKISMKWK